ncbi:MAG TPA: Sec-independent protein translocase protein TatB [Arenimonas sp.]|uniref:Sec-independent protein translocase protein TatB n=1 Tax=Arenimonas sp. TaxID=1872635 RepID=UPI002D7FB1B9|nr:Sec-independent protein translocase protein TatB [Arenimonas sp.]HEU0153125.1 Sec-independent protein translocase protein TatB [Arenimonas sp.]
MFDVGFSELLIIAVVALVVLGPERLPKAARFAGLWVRKARAQWYSVKSEFEREMAADELKRSVGNPVQSIREELDAVGKDVAATGQALRDDLRDAEALAKADADTAVQDIPAAADAAPPTDADRPAPAGADDRGADAASTPEPEFYSDPVPFQLTPDAPPPDADAPRRDGTREP